MSKSAPTSRLAALILAHGAGLLVAVIAAFSTASAQAHHAFAAEFDAEQPIEIKGEVTKLQLVNPHSWIYVDAKDAAGKPTNWGFEFAAPYSLQQRGLSKADLPVGTEVVLKGFRAKSGKDFAYAVTVRLPDGRVIPVGGAQNVPGVADNNQGAVQQ
jgi:hypothetical protein